MTNQGYEHSSRLIGKASALQSAMARSKRASCEANQICLSNANAWKKYGESQKFKEVHYDEQDKMAGSLACDCYVLYHVSILH